MTNNTDDMTYEELYGTKILYGGGDFSWENSQHRDYFSPFSLYRWPNMSGEPGSGRKIVRKYSAYFDGKWSDLHLNDWKVLELLTFLTDDKNQEIMKKELRDISDHITDDEGVRPAGPLWLHITKSREDV